MRRPRRKAIPDDRRGRRGGGTVFYDKDRKCYVGQVSYIDDAGNGSARRCSGRLRKRLRTSSMRYVPN